MESPIDEPDRCVIFLVGDDQASNSDNYRSDQMKFFDNFEEKRYESQ